MSMSGIFNASIFNDDIFNTGIEVEEGIGLAPKPPPVDFVYSADGWYSDFGSHTRTQKLVFLEKLRASRQEKKELREMIDLYTRWKKAA